MSGSESVSLPQLSGTCAVCGGVPPLGHRFCDSCWPEAAIASGKAAFCAICLRPRVVEKLQPQFSSSGPLVCISHLLLPEE